MARALLMTSDLLRTVGEALYGERWQVPLARALGVSDRNLRYWAVGKPIPDIRDRLAALLSGRQRQIAQALQALSPH